MSSAWHGRNNLIDIPLGNTNETRRDETSRGERDGLVYKWQDDATLFQPKWSQSAQMCRVKPQDTPTDEHNNHSTSFFFFLNRKRVEPALFQLDVTWRYVFLFIENVPTNCASAAAARRESERWWSGSGWWCRTEMMIVVVIISEEATFWLVRPPFAFLRFSSLHSSSEWWKCFSSLPFQKEIIMTRTVTLGVRSRSCSHSTTSCYPIVFHLLSVFSCSRWSSQHQFSSTVHLSS